MKLEQAKSQILPEVVTPSKKQAPAKTLPLQAKAATPSQLQRAKSKLEQDRSQIQRQAEEASLQRIARAASQEQARIQRSQDQALAQEQQVQLQRLADTQARQQSFFSSFVKSPVQRKSQQQVKISSVQTAQVRDQYQAAVQPEILQRLVDDRLSLQSKTAQAEQPQNALNTRAEWFNTELPVLRAKHNHPDTPFLDGANVFKPADQQAFTLGRTYGVQRLASGLTPTDAANAILNIQRKADRDIAMRGLLTGINPRQSDYTSIQRLVAQGEANFELQRQALLEDPSMQSQALQSAKDEAHPTTPNSGISDKIKTKLGGGNPLPENVRQQLETGLNTDLSGVRVHTDNEADFLSKSVQAKAFTTGSDIFFSSGAFDPNTKSGYELIAHETTHTIQQAAGQVKPGIDSDPSLEAAAQSKGAELAAGFNPNFKYKNLENQAQPNSPLIASQPPAHRARIQAMQRSSLQHQPLQREPQAASPVVTPTVSQTLDETALATLTTALLPVVPQKYQTDAQSNIPVILRQCFSSQIKNANQVAYILATAQHESRFGTKMYTRSESLVEDHNPLQTEHKKIKDKKTGKTTVQDIPYRSNHVTGSRVNADPSNTNDLDTYYDKAYGGKLGNVKGSSDAANYRGRGFVQITGRDNYKRLGQQLQNEGFTYTYNNQTYGGKEQPIDLVANPTHVNLVPELAAKLMTSGMQNDSFAQGGKGLSTYVNDKTTDFVGARGLVNGTDRAADIAKIAEDFAKILTANNAWSNLFTAPDLTKQAPDATKPSVIPIQRVPATSTPSNASSSKPIQASREGVSPQTLESTPTPQFANQNVQRQAKNPAINNIDSAQKGFREKLAKYHQSAQAYRIMLNSSEHSLALRKYLYGEGKPLLDKAEQLAKVELEKEINPPGGWGYQLLTALPVKTQDQRDDILLDEKMTTVFNDHKAQSIFVLGKVLDPQTTTKLRNQYNTLQGSEKQSILASLNAERNKIPIYQLHPTTISENEIFGQLGSKFAEFCLYKVMLAKYPNLSQPTQSSAQTQGSAMNQLAAAWTPDGANMRDAPNAEGKIIFKYAFGDRFLILAEANQWYKVRSLKDNREGWVANFTNPPILKFMPEPAAKVYMVVKNDTASNIVINHYPNTDTVLNRARRHFLIAALQSMNPVAMPRISGGGWDDVQVLANNAIWLPSEAFANTLQGKVTVNDNFSGAALDAMASATNQTLQAGSYMVKAVLEQMPGGEKVLQTINDIGANAKLVFDNPEAFIKNLTKAVSTGFNSFGANIGTHLQTGMIGVLTGQLGGSGVTLPKTFNSEGVLSVGLQLVGLNAASLEQRLAKEIPGGMQAVNGMKETADLFKQVQTNGLIVTAKEHFEGLGELKNLVFSSIQSWAQSTLIKKALEVLGSALIPGAGIVQAAIKIYETITFIWDKFKMIASTLNAIVGSLADIAKGNIDGAVQKIVTSLVGGLGLAIGFLVKISGLEGIATRIKTFFQNIKTKIDTMIDKVIKWFKDKIGTRGWTRPAGPTVETPGTAKPGTATPGATDPEHDKKVQKGLDQIDGEEAKIDAKDNDGKLTKAQAEQVAATVKQNNRIFSKILVDYNVTKNYIDYKWYASVGTRRSSRKPYTDDLEPAANEGTRANPFPINWPKPASANYPKLYFGAQRTDYKSQADLKQLVGGSDDKGVIVREYSPHTQTALPNGDLIGVSANYHLQVGTVVGPLAKSGIKSPGGKVLNTILAKYGFRPEEDKLDGDHIHEIQLGGPNIVENMWPLSKYINRSSGKTIDETSVPLASNKSIKVYQLRELVEKTNRQFYFEVSSVK